MEEQWLTEVVDKLRSLLNPGEVYRCDDIELRRVWSADPETGNVIDHRQVETSRDGTLVDAGIAPLIEALWSTGYETQHSCEEMTDADGHLVFQIVFSRIEHAFKFLTLSTDLLPSACWYRCVLRPMSVQDGSQRASVHIPAQFLPVVMELWTQCVSA